MSRPRVSKPQKSLLARALLGALAVFSANSSLAATNYLVGMDVTDPTAWSAGEIVSDGANVINTSGAWWADDNNDYLEVGYGLFIGYQGQGSLNITITPDLSDSYFYIDNPQYNPNPDPGLPALIPNWDPILRVGESGGTGSLVIDMQALPEDEWRDTRFYTDNIGLGVGLGSDSSGSVEILGTGKSTQQISYRAPNHAFFGWAEENFLIGHMGGQGNLTIDGAGFTAGIGNDYDESLPLNYFSVGEGLNSVGDVQVLGSGKLAVGIPIEMDVEMRANELPLGFIGKDGGQGQITVGQTTTEIQSQTAFYLGLAVGHSGGQGTLNTLQGGKSFINNGGSWDLRDEGVCYASEPSEYPLAPAPLQISVDGISQGVVRTSGEGSELLVAGKANNDSYQEEVTYIKQESIGAIQIGTGGRLVAENSGTIKVGVSHLQRFEGADDEYYSRTTVGGLGPITVAGEGAVVYGSETATPSALGHIEASSIDLTGPEARLRFNHTGNLSFNLPLTGNGQLTQQAGTTSIASTLAGLPVLDPAVFAFDSIAPCIPSIANNYPIDQAAFVGGIDVQGGTMVLPVSNILPGLSSTRISGGTLMMGSTDQNLNAVTQTGGLLQLSGGSTPSATNTATASSWAGGNGTVRLDSVLGTDGSDSDKLRITGPITGTTYLQIANLGGSGAQTQGDGILVVEATSSNPSNSFALQSRVIQGQFEYTLRQTGNNWFLVSSPYVAPPQAAIPVPTLSWLHLFALAALLGSLSSRSLLKQKRPSNRS